jgi:hypothetical protein
LRSTYAVISFSFALSLFGCASSDSVRFQASGNQSAIVRDGKPALVSRRKSSLVLVSPAARQIDRGSRPVFVVAINNLSAVPLDFRVSDVTVTQELEGQQVSLPIITYDELVSEERPRQAVRAVLVGASAAANAYGAANAGYGSSYSSINATTYSPRGSLYQTSATAQTNFYDPTAAAIAQSNARAQNDAMIGSTIEQGQANLRVLERSVIKDNTIMPGEWYGGQLHFTSPQKSAGEKDYRILIKVGDDTHEVDVAQVPAQ